ncbi:hypothetical protein [Acinetobacter sp. GXMZU3951]
MHNMNNMLSKLKRYILFRLRKISFISQLEKKLIFYRMRRVHQQLLQQIKGKEKIKVVFLTIHKSIWKVDPVFQKMLIDPFFEPVILVCPYILHGEERMWQDMKECYEYFKEKGYPLLSSYDKEEECWIKISELNPDIVFFTNPHNLTRKEYYEDVYLNYLSCYVPYYSDVASDYDLNSSYNQLFHNVVWKHFIGDEYAKKRALNVLSNKGANLFVTGSPVLEELAVGGRIEPNRIWRQQLLPKKRVIYAPHQSIFKDENINLSTFLEVGELIKNFAEKYQSQIQWSFKPHTLLKTKLYKHPDWGKEKTDKYYDFWKFSEFTQLDEGGYVDLFNTSDAIIHDCGSFILDYLFTGKPCAYLELNPTVQLKAINDYGIELLNCYVRLHDENEIEHFLCNLISENLYPNKSYEKFIIEHVNEFYKLSSPSANIINHLKQELM